MNNVQAAALARKIRREVTQWAACVEIVHDPQEGNQVAASGERLERTFGRVEGCRDGIEKQETEEDTYETRFESDALSEGSYLWKPLRPLSIPS